jgi:integrase
LRSVTGDEAVKYLMRDSDRHGTARVYARMNGRKVRLYAPEGTPDFAREYLAAIERLEKPAPKATGRREIVPGTLAWLGVQYFASARFLALDPASQRNRRSILESCFREPRKAGAPEIFGECPLAVLSARQVIVMRDRKASQPGAANNRLKYMSAMFRWGVQAGHLNANPARDVEAIRYASTGFHTWTPEEVAQYEAKHPVGTKARLALALLLYTGARRQDVVLFGRQHVRDGVLTFSPRKTRKSKAKTITLPMLPELQEIIAASPCGDLTFLVTEYGRGFTAAGFGGWFKERCLEAGLDECTAHGLRKAGATRAAENGATDRELMAIFGWETASQATTYTRAADQKKLASRAVQLLSRGTK